MTTQTELMPKGFRVLAGADARREENAAQARWTLTQSSGLARFQETWGRKYRPIEVVSSIYGWYVRHGSGLQGFAIIENTLARGGRLDGSLSAAVDYAQEWVTQVPHSYAYIRTGSLSADDAYTLDTCEALAEGAV